MLEGAGTLRVAGEMLPLRTGDIAFIPAGPEYPHQIINTSDAPLQYLSISTRDMPEIVEYPDSGKFLAMNAVHESRFELLSGEASLIEYRFHTMTARHFFCRTCGIYPFHCKRVTPDHFGVNVFCLEDFDPAGIPVRRAVGAAMA